MISPFTQVSEILDKLLSNDLLGREYMISQLTNKKYNTKFMSKDIVSLIDLKLYWNNHMIKKTRKKMIENAFASVGLWRRKTKGSKRTPIDDVVDMLNNDKKINTISDDLIDKYADEKFERLPYIGSNKRTINFNKIRGDIEGVNVRKILFDYFKKRIVSFEVTK